MLPLRTETPWLIAAVVTMASCGSCHDGCSSSKLERASASTRDRIETLDLVESSHPDLRPLTPMTRVIVEPAGISVDNITVLNHWWNNSARSDSEVIYERSFNSLLIDRPLVAPFTDWKLDAALLRDGPGGLFAEPVNKGVRDANKVETRLVRDLGEQWSSGQLSIWAGADTPFSAIAPVIHVAAHNGYTTVHLVVLDDSTHASIALGMPRFKPKGSGDCTAVHARVTEKGLAGMDASGPVCVSGSISVDPPVRYSTLIRALEALHQEGIDRIDILLSAPAITTLGKP